MDFLSETAVAFATTAKVTAMRDVMSPRYLPLRPYRITRGKRQMREKRTAQALMIFGIVLAWVEFYVILGSL
jgi:hypothetical protein